MRLRLALAGVLAAAAVVAVPAAASADTGTLYQVTGTEIAFTSTEGHFVGYALGSDQSAGAFDAVVDHQPLGTTSSPAITGGTFSLGALGPSGVTSLTGTFSGGTITPENPGANCTNQTFAVDGTVSLAGGGTGTFDVTLTHHRFRLFTACITYAGTISGTLTVP